MSPRKHHRHSYYLIVHGDPAGLLREEVLVVAAIARYHRGATPAPSSRAMAKLPAHAQPIVAPLTAILRIADGLDCRHRQVVRSLRFAREARVARISIAADGHDAASELWAGIRKAAFWESEFGLKLTFGVGRRRAVGSSRKLHNQIIQGKR